MKHPGFYLLILLTLIIGIPACSTVEPKAEEKECQPKYQTLITNTLIASN